MTEEKAQSSGIRRFVQQRRVQYSLAIILAIIAIAVAVEYVGLPTMTVTTPFTSHVTDPLGSCSNNSLNFQPPTISVVVGVNSTVSWLNNDTCPHDAHADLGKFYSGVMQPGSSFVFTFNSRGTFTYHCDYHGWMRGTIVVLTS